MSASEVHEMIFLKREEQINTQNKLNSINKEIEDLKALANEFERKVQKAQKAKKTSKPTSLRGPKAKKTGSPRKPSYTKGNAFLVEKAKILKKAATFAIEEARSSIKM
jgi:hypothetical protein